jgi:hypothetical protein
MLLTVNALTPIYGKHKNLEDCSENSMKVFFHLYHVSEAVV